MARFHFTGMPAFTILWMGQVISLVGTALFSFALAIWLYQQTGQATTITTLIFFSNLPRIMSLLIFLAAIVGISVPSLSYAIPAFRNVEDIIPDHDVESPQPPKATDTGQSKSSKPIPRPSADD